MAEPVMERSDMAEFGKKIVAEFVMTAPGDKPEITALRLTSGTSGKGPVMVVTQTDVVSEGRHYADSSRVVSAFIGSRSTRLKQTLILRRTGPERRHCLILDSKDITPRLEPLLRQFSPDAIIGFPTNIIAATPFMSEDIKGGVKTMVTSGEQISHTASEFFRQQFPNARIASFYGTAETSEIAGPCPFDPTRIYHPTFHPSPGVLIEIDEPDEGGVGDILVTKTLYRDQKVNRYRTGDAGSISNDVCQCGARISLKLAGRRGYDFIRVQGLFLLKEEFDRVAASLSEYISEYRAEAYTTGTVEVPRCGIILSIYRKEGPLSAAELETVRSLFAERLFVTATLTLADAILNGHCVPLEVVAVTEPFPKQHKNVTLTLRPV
ncbi:MAG: hypothetical protein WC050_04470 [Candidatus Paceibacterota bacterium]